MKSYTEIERKQLQDNLPLIRQVGGWKTEEFGNMIGVTKQTISNIENNKTDLTKIQYIAIRAVLDYEMKSNDILANIVTLLLDTENLSPEDETKIKNAAVFVSGAKKNGLDNSAVSNGFRTLLGSLPVLMIAGFETGVWLAKLLKNKNK